MELTIHAAKQARRRGVNAGLMDFIIQNGEEYKAGGGCSLHRITAKEQRFLKNDDPAGWKSGRDKLRVVLVTNGEVVVTAMHRERPLYKSNRLA